MEDIQELVFKLAEKHGRSRESLLPILQGIVHKMHFLSSEAMTLVASELDMSAAQVFGTATFYSFLDTQPRGKYVIRICKTISCDMHGKREVMQTIEEMLKIGVGETTSNKKFTLLETNCLGWCHKAPAMLINDEPYTELNADKVREIINKYIRK